MRTFKQHLKEFWGAGEVSDGQLQGHQSSLAIEAVSYTHLTLPTKA